VATPLNRSVRRTLDRRSHLPNDGAELMFDSRLIGTWRSDRSRTKKEIEALRDIPTRRRPKLIRMFGKLTLRYTRTRCYSTFDGDTDVAPYRVLAKNSYEVVITAPSYLDGELKIQHIHFEGEYYWVTLGAFREYFRRVSGPRKKGRRRGRARK
jgi:hypothetical protein